MKILITGITGFIGTGLAAKLTDDGCVVAGLVRPGKKNESKCFYEYDGTFSSVKNTIDLFKPQVIVHLATTYFSNTSNIIDSLVSTNISLPFFLFEATKNTGVKIVCAGSYWQFGNDEEFKSLDVYAATKTAADSLIEYYTFRENMRAVILYFYGTYGSNDKRGKVLDYILQSIISGEKFKLSPGEQKLNLVHIDDIVRAIQIIVNDDDLISGKVHKFGVFSDSSYTLKEIISICQKYYDRPVSVEFGAIPYRERELMEPQYPYSTVPGWNESMNIKTYINTLLNKNK